MIVFSGFDGMSCGQIALNRIGIKPTKYYASEIDKYAIQVTQANYPDTVQMGDITKWREWDIDLASIDLIIGGSPCQGFSFAGKQLAFDDPRSALFFVWVDILNHVKSLNPRVKFLLENVKMKKDHLEVITGVVGVDPIFINSNLVSAQNRQRFYWCNWFNDQPDDKGIFLKDILESEPFEKTIMSDKFTTRNANILRDDLTGKAKSLSAMEYVKNGRQGDYIAIKQPPRDEKGMCIDANYHKGADNHGQRTLIKCGQMIGYSYHRNDGLIKPLDKAYPLNATDWRGLNRNQNQTAVTDTVNYRKLTTIECERLQTVLDNYTNHVSNTQRYKMLGNGWTVDVIAHLLTFMQIDRILPQCHK